MSIEFIEEIHEQVNLQGADAKDHVLLCLGPVPTVVPSRFLPLHPQIHKFLKLWTTDAVLRNRGWGTGLIGANKTSFLAPKGMNQRLRGRFLGDYETWEQILFFSDLGQIFSFSLFGGRF